MTHGMGNNKNDQSEWLALLGIKGVGPRKAHALLTYFGTAKNIFQSTRADLKHSGLSKKIIDQILKPDQVGVEQALVWQDAHPQNQIISFHDARYPELLKELTDPPIVLFTKGDPELLNRPQVAIVGSRHATPGGLEYAQEFARRLSQSGFVITSGLALGIDAAAHTGALQANGLTTAVSGTGPDRIYPARNLPLAEKIIADGLIVSEFVPGTKPRKENFPRRNRIISGLSIGTLVVEAAVHSGSLITARFALEQGREVFAIPGSIKNPLARGCHALIRDGAKLVESVDDILEELAPLIGAFVVQSNSSASEKKQETGTGEQQQLLDHMGFDPVTVDKLVTKSGLTASEVSSMLLSLELEGYVSSLAGGKYLKS